VRECAKYDESGWREKTSE